jgi:hypothetical protein
MKMMHKKMLFVGVIAVLSMLLAGAGQMTGVIMGELDERQNEKIQLSEQVLKMLPHIPPQYHEQWKQAAQENPALLLRLNTTDFGFRPTR